MKILVKSKHYFTGQLLMDSFKVIKSFSKSIQSILKAKTSFQSQDFVLMTVKISEIMCIW